MWHSDQISLKVSIQIINDILLLNSRQCHQMTRGGGRGQPKCHVTFFEQNLTTKSLYEAMHF